MKQTVFRKVYVKDRLPKQGWHHTNKGIEYYSEQLNDWASSMYKSKPEWFLEEIELPTEQELRKESLGKFSEAEAQDEEIGDYIEDDAIQFMKGANYILNKLK